MFQFLPYSFPGTMRNALAATTSYTVVFVFRATAFNFSIVSDVKEGRRNNTDEARQPVLVFLTSIFHREQSGSLEL